MRLSFLLLPIVTTTADSSSAQLRALVPNLSNLFGSARSTAKTPYERVANHPVFQVTTSWGAPYMTFEKVDDDMTASTKGSAADQNILGYGGDMRPVTLFYMDPEDALAMHQEMKQMQNMAKSDIRITATTLAKAIRQSSNFGDGLPTGTPVDANTGDLPTIQDGGSLRYKIVPSRRQLFYAATKCPLTRERVGLFGESGAEDAAIVLDAALDASNQQRRRNVRNGKSRAMTASQRQYRHMEGYIGIPVFYCPSMRKSWGPLKGLLGSGGSNQENPLFFSYEDLQEAYTKMRKSKFPNAPKTPPNVEVYNLMDVLTSMDREDKPKFDFRKPLNGLQRLQKAIKGNDGPGLDCMQFIPSSHAVDYKQDLADRGNGKSRLRPMKGPWGPASA